MAVNGEKHRVSGRWTAIAALLGCLVAAGCSADATGGSVPAGPSTGALHASDPHASGSSHATA
ncbi:hypothetical protein AB2R52_27415, partial [Klebsiella pneumoniae]|uniref:hypothetical protein n=1 Tax=Klebsiella pneumoniae TaxID=573 RepID=UPI00346268CE